MQCFADQPVVRSSLGVSWAGREAIQAIMAYRLTDDYTVQNVQVGGNRVTWSEHVRRGATGGATVNFDEDVEAVVVGGRITSMVTYVGSSRPQLTVAPSPPANDPFLPLSVLLLVAGAVMAWPSSRPAADDRARQQPPDRGFAGVCRPASIGLRIKLGYDPKGRQNGCGVAR